jgi:hypothetical protein
MRFEVIYIYIYNNYLIIIQIYINLFNLINYTFEKLLKPARPALKNGSAGETFIPPLKISVTQQLRCGNINYKEINILLKLIKFIFNFPNFIKVGIDIGKLVQNNIIIINILDN